MSKWGVVKLVGSGKLKSGVDKGDVRGKQKRETQKKKKTIVKHERWIVVILIFEFEQISRLLL